MLYEMIVVENHEVSIPYAARPDAELFAPNARWRGSCLWRSRCATA